MKPVKHKSNDYVIRVHNSPDEVDAADWNELLGLQAQATPFMRHEYLSALHASGAAVPATGWTPHVKTHSYGEYVFDRAWANAYAQHGLAYYPKALVAVPFTPVPGARLLARSSANRGALISALLKWCETQQLSSLHLLFASADDLQACSTAGMLLRHTVQFHWKNTEPAYVDFEDFLTSLSQDKRKKIRQERRKVADAGVGFRCAQGADITAQDWDFFYRCYERTYLEHGNAPYLSRDFFLRMASTMPEHWLLFIAERQGRPIAASLVAIQAEAMPSTDSGASPAPAGVAYGRYWGALERVDCLHFEACYYQPLQWCIAHGFQRFEGGAQGEHKMARALLPVKASSAHWLAHPAFADAVERFLESESEGVQQYLDELVQRSPFRHPAAA